MSGVHTNFLYVREKTEVSEVFSVCPPPLTFVFDETLHDEDEVEVVLAVT